MKFIVEHREPELFPWCLIEYKHISKIAGKENVIFTNIKKGKRELQKWGTVYKKSILQLKFPNAYVLDPSAQKTLSPQDRFDTLILGGILGDHPPRARTKKELSLKLPYPTRNLGKKQFSTDTAVYVARKIMQGKKLNDLQFRDGIEIHLNTTESVELPFTYVLRKGKPLLPPGLIKHLRERKEF